MGGFFRLRLMPHERQQICQCKLCPYVGYEPAQRKKRAVTTRPALGHREQKLPGSCEGWSEAVKGGGGPGEGGLLRGEGWWSWTW